MCHAISCGARICASRRQPRPVRLTRLTTQGDTHAETDHRPRPRSVGRRVELERRRDRAAEQGFTVSLRRTCCAAWRSTPPYIASFLAQRTSGPVVLVGHSYGGFVITNAATGGGDVRALVYVDAFVPDEGETVFQILGGSGSALDVPDPTTVLDLVGYPGAPRVTSRRSSSRTPCTTRSPRTCPRPTAG